MTAPVVTQLTDDIFRVVWTPHGDFDRSETTTFSVVGTAPESVPFCAEGVLRSQVAMKCFGVPQVEDHAAGASRTVASSTLRCVQGPDGCLTWEAHVASEWRVFHHDIHYRHHDADSGCCGFGSPSLVHRFHRGESYAYYGLGEASGGLNKAGRRVRMRPTDCMGYDAATSDPLYKHMPFLITYVPQLQYYYGVFYDTTHECVFDLGCEMNNYYGLYSTFATRSTSLDYYLIAGPTLHDVVSRFSASVVGCIPKQPSWSFGYLGSAMGYTDDPQAMEALGGFLATCKALSVPCSGFHLSSGYTMNDADGKRYVFEWNTTRYASPKALSAMFHHYGVRLIANIKPAMLTTHPKYTSAAREGLFIKCGPERPGGDAALCTFWGGDAAYFDFTNQATRDYWKHRVTSTLLENNIDSTWNDNNEYTEIVGIASTGARAAGLRPVQTLLMTGSSFEAQCEFAAQQSKSADHPPFVLTRSGMYGSHRIASTWTGDNFTSWKTLRYNIPMGLGLCISGWSNIGHDVGGFAGPSPTPELMYRWVQQGILTSRFSIHSWKIGRPENSCWMFESSPTSLATGSTSPDALLPITKALCALVRVRHCLRPFLSQINELAASRSAPVPMMAPVLYYYPFHHDTYGDEYRIYFLGPSMLVCPALEEGVTRWTVRLPPGEWYSFDGARHISAESPIEIEVSSPLWGDVQEACDLAHMPPVFVRSGTVVPLGDAAKVELRCYATAADSAALLTCQTLPAAYIQQLTQHLALNPHVGGLSVCTVAVGDRDA